MVVPKRHRLAMALVGTALWLGGLPHADQARRAYTAASEDTESRRRRTFVPKGLTRSARQAVARVFDLLERGQRIPAKEESRPPVRSGRRDTDQIFQGCLSHSCARRADVLVLNAG